MAWKAWSKIFVNNFEGCVDNTSYFFSLDALECSHKLKSQPNSSSNQTTLTKYSNSMTSSPSVHCLFHADTNTATYVVSDPKSNHAMIIDPVMDYDAAAARTSNDHNDKVISYVETQQLKVDYIVETHVHADHLTGADYLKAKLGGPQNPNIQTAIGEHVTKVQKVFQNIFGLDPEKDNFLPDGSQFDMLLKDGQEFELGTLMVKVMHTPGHTPACINLIVGDAVFTGDTLFMPDSGTARCDFPGGSVTDMYTSIQKLYNALPDETRVFVGHDYGAGGSRDIKYETTIGEQKNLNKQLNSKTTLEEFEAFRSARDSPLKPPRLILPSLQVNLRNGALPPPEENGTSYLKLPINVLGAKK